MHTHSRCLDVTIDVCKHLLIGLRILSPNQDMERDLSTLQWFQMLCYRGISYALVIAGCLKCSKYLSLQL